MKPAQRKFQEQFNRQLRIESNPDDFKEEAWNLFKNTEASKSFQLCIEAVQEARGICPQCGRESTGFGSEDRLRITPSGKIACKICEEHETITEIQ